MSRTRARWRAGVLAAAIAAATGVAEAGTSSQQNPTVTFDTYGDKTVTLQVCNSAGCSSITRTITVLDPRPKITSAWVSTWYAEAGEQVQLYGAATGQPQLGYVWRLVQAGATQALLPGASPIWLTGETPPGDYEAYLDVSNSSGTTTSWPSYITIAPSRPLDFYTVTPCRVVDTREGTAIATGEVRTIPVAGWTCGIPADARAVAGNVTVVGPTSGGLVTVFPATFSGPQGGTTSTVGFSAGQTRAAFVVMPLGRELSGQVMAVPALAQPGTVHLVLDVTGYFAPEW